MYQAPPLLTRAAHQGASLRLGTVKSHGQPSARAKGEKRSHGTLAVRDDFSCGNTPVVGEADQLLVLGVLSLDSTCGIYVLKRSLTSSNAQ